MRSRRACIEFSLSTTTFRGCGSSTTATGVVLTLPLSHTLSWSMRSESDGDPSIHRTDEPDGFPFLSFPFDSKNRPGRGAFNPAFLPFGWVSIAIFGRVDRYHADTIDAHGREMSMDEGWFGNGASIHKCASGCGGRASWSSQVCKPTWRCKVAWTGT